MVYRRAEVFSGGGGKGFYYLGHMRAKRDLKLTDRDLGDVSWKLGVSVGGYAAAASSLGLSPEEAGSFIEAKMNIIKKAFRPDYSLIAHYVCRSIGEFIARKNHSGENGNHDYSNDEISRVGFFSSERLERIARELVGEKKFKDLPDLNLLVTEWGSFQSILLNSETCPDAPVYKGLAATSSYDFVSPVIIDVNGKKKICADGGMSNNMPLNLALSVGSINEIVCVDLLHASSLNKVPFTLNPLKNFTLEKMFSGVQRTRGLFEFGLGLDYDEVVKRKMIKIERDGAVKKVLYLTPNIHYSRTFHADTENFQELAEMGYKESLEILAEFEKFKAA
ncbi:MAG: patatin-like phospholipase family protein [Candidatus Pacearchaeota archaeon]|nr:patatin-like phospholipase family protein [Candidatus Pacearchaeota archaeon]MDE1848989.1 patatin-like phospholipase family protein [Nanoarchaeota archaeon]